MKAAETKLQNLLEGGKHYQIPLFQRPYSWREPNWTTLWEDLASVDFDVLNQYQFLGPIVTLANDAEPEGISSFVVIDGQQRLTTLTVLLAALRDRMRLDGSPVSARADEIQDLYLINRFKEGDAHLKVLPSEADREAYRSIILEHASGAVGPIREAYDFFSKRLAGVGLDEDEVPVDLTVMMGVILGRTTLVSIRLDDDDNPYLIFESLNYKGEPLTQADLVRNFIFMRLPAANREQVFLAKWRPLQEAFRAAAGDDLFLNELTNAFWYYLRKDGANIRSDAVYKTIKDHAEKAPGSLPDYLDDLARYSQFYRRMRFPDVEPEPRLANWFRRFLRLDYSTSYPFLLAVYSAYESGTLTLEDFETILRHVESYFIRRLFVGIPTNSLGKVFNGLSAQIDRDDWANSVIQVLRTFGGSLRWPDDEETSVGIRTRPIYGTRLDRLKLLLETIDDSLSKEHVEHANLQIEHVMPQELTVAWNAELGDRAHDVYSRLLHTLGNLTLTGYNPEMSNKPFADKLQWLRGSPIPLNRYFDAVDYWDENEIGRHAKALADAALSIWPR